jgi:cell wall-associated NlpC family hydrolase
MPERTSERGSRPYDGQVARYTAEQIYAFAREAGFSPDQAATMTAVALAESRGNSGAHNPKGEDSRGLWQINVRSHGALGQTDLYDPVQNAKATYAVSQGGTDISPWTTTHGGLSARYLRYRGDAEAAAAAYGDGPGHGMWSGTSGYGDHVGAGPSGGSTPDDAAHRQPAVTPAAPAATTVGSDATVVASAETTPGAVGGSAEPARVGSDYGIPLDTGEAQPHTTAADGTDARPGADYGIPLESPGTTGIATPAAQVANQPAEPAGTVEPVATDAGAHAAKLQEFLNVAVAQTGDHYVWGAHASFDDPNPSAFDCSDLVQWATHRVGITTMPRTAWEQYEYLHKGGHAIPIDQAIHTPGALLFSFSSDPDTTHPGHCHVAISLGNGKTMEAKGSQYGVGSWAATTKRFEYAAVIPELAGGSPTHAPVAPTPSAATPVTTASLVDQFEYRLRTDPSTMDSHPAVLTASEHLTSAQPDPNHHEPAPTEPSHDDGVAYVDDVVDHGGTDDALANATHWVDPTDAHDHLAAQVDHHVDQHVIDHAPEAH